MSRSMLLAAVLLAMVLSSDGRAATLAAVPLPTHAVSPIDGVASGGSYAVVEMGTQAPDFSFESTSGWKHLRDVRAQGHVLLLIAPDDEQLLALERERTQLLALGIVPMAVLDRRMPACRALATRLNLGFALVSDTKHVIGAQFNAVAAASGMDAVAWFAIERTGRVRDLAHGDWPSRPWRELCASAFGLPANDAPLPASYPR